MLPSLCRVMAAIPSVSRFLEPLGGGPRGGAEAIADLASMPLAGSIGTWIVAPLF